MNPSQLFDAQINRAYFENDLTSHRALMDVREQVRAWEENMLKELKAAARRPYDWRSYSDDPWVTIPDAPLPLQS